MKSHDTLDEQAIERVADYVLEALPAPARADFEQHLTQCSLCTREVKALRSLTDTLSEPALESAPRPDLWERVEQRLGFSEQKTSDQKGIEFHFGASEEGWSPAPLPGIETRILSIDLERDRVTFEARMQPGAAYPPHEHHGPEECFVLQGDLWVGDVHMQAGDYQSVESGSHHAVQSTDGGCMLLLSACAANSPLAWA